MGKSDPEKQQARRERRVHFPVAKQAIATTVGIFERTKDLRLDKEQHNLHTPLYVVSKAIGKESMFGMVLGAEVFLLPDKDSLSRLGSTALKEKMDTISSVRLYKYRLEYDDEQSVGEPIIDGTISDAAELIQDVGFRPFALASYTYANELATRKDKRAEWKGIQPDLKQLESYNNDVLQLSKAITAAYIQSAEI